MLLSDILNGIDYSCDNFKNTDIVDITYNSKNAGEGKCFFCLSGTVTDGHKFARSAYDGGCRCIFAEHTVELPEDCVQIITDDTRHALAIASANFFGRPCEKLKVVGITGTKGKTTTAHIVKALIEASGEMCGIIGTNGAAYGNASEETKNTTPESYELQRLFRKMVDAGCKYCVIEASSLGLKMHRTDGIPFEVGVFMNLAPDHIGTIEHPTFEDYKNSKKLLFKMCRHAVVNVDDPAYTDMLEGSSADVTSFGLGDADVRAENVELLRSKDILGVSFDCIDGEGRFCIEASIPGYFNVYNVLAAAAVCGVLGFEVKKYKDVFRSFSVAGRFEPVHVSDDFDVIIDFAHNGLSMHNIISTLKAYPHKRIIVLFGAIGEKNQIRRKELGLVAGREADLSILTTEDPGREDPVKIAEEIASYIRQTGGKYMIIRDRREAIVYALSHMQKGDILVLAGKGNETFMKINGGMIPYSEREEVEKYIKSKKN